MKLMKMINWYTFINSNVLQNKKININVTHCHQNYIIVPISYIHNITITIYQRNNNFNIVHWIIPIKDKLIFSLLKF